MKRVIIFCLLAMMNLAVFAQTAVTVSGENYVTEVFKDVFVEMPEYREISSGSKIVVTYEGVSAEMQGAFEYAVKIWEEVLPMTLPINITVNTARIRGSKDVLSKISYSAMEFAKEKTCDYLSPITLVKSVVLQESHSPEKTRYSDEIDDITVLDEPDIIITYNENLLNDFDFSLDGERNLNKYDFVTVAMRDIAFGMGFLTKIQSLDNAILIREENLYTPYELLIMRELQPGFPFTNIDSGNLFSKATKGFVDIPLCNWYGVKFGTLSVYAPTTWINGVSLCHLIPDDNPISKLLTYDFGKGYVIRDLSGVNWDDVFCGALDWRRAATTGTGPTGSYSDSGTTNDVLPYRGQVVLSFDDSGNKSFSIEQNNIGNISTSNSIQFAFNANLGSSDIVSIEDYCRLFNLYSPTEPEAGYQSGISLSVLKKDGTWDCIYMTNDTYNPITVNVENLNLNFSDEEYARSVSGGLRYRLTKCIHTAWNSDSYTAKYFTRGFTPQKPIIKYTGEPAAQSMSIINRSMSDDWFVDVKVGIANIEGTDRVIVEQLDEGEDYPFLYEVEDFRKGYFIANLDRECSTKLTVTSYNENGFKRSETITIPALGNLVQKAELGFENCRGEYLMINGLSEDILKAGNLNCSIRSLSGTYSQVCDQKISDGRINISELPKGFYLVSVYLNSNEIGNYKFAK